MSKDCGENKKVLEKQGGNENEKMGKIPYRDFGVSGINR